MSNANGGVVSVLLTLLLNFSLYLCRLISLMPISCDTEYVQVMQCLILRFSITYMYSRTILYSGLVERVIIVSHNFLKFCDKNLQLLVEVSTNMFTQLHSGLILL